MNVVPIPTQPQDEVTVCFQTWYTIYPRKEAKKDAQKAWNGLSDAQQLAAIIGIAAWRKVLLDRCQGNVHYIPLPASWIRGERWEDSLPADNMPTHASHVQAQSTPLPERGQIPPDVLQRIKSIMGARK